MPSEKLTCVSAVLGNTWRVRGLLGKQVYPLYVLRHLFGAIWSCSNYVTSVHTSNKATARVHLLDALQQPLAQHAQQMHAELCSTINLLLLQFYLGGAPARGYPALLN